MINKSGIPSTLTFALVFLCIGLLSCRLFDSGDKSIDYVNPRELVWDLDTLAIPNSDFTYLNGIWGSSPDDVYAVGSQEGLDGQMWHYDGDNWSPVPIAVENGGKIDGAFDLTDVFGFSRNNIWAVGINFPPDSPDDSKLILHYNGTDWEKAESPPGGMLFRMFGTDSKHIWAGGAYGTIMQYDGKEWERNAVDLPPSVDPPGFFTAFFPIDGMSKTDVYAYLYTSMDYSYLMKFNGTRWTMVDSLETLYSSEGMWVSPSGKVYTAGWTQISMWEDGNLTTLVECDCWFYSIAGFTDDNFIVAGLKLVPEIGSHSYVLHYNGVDWAELPAFSDKRFTFTDIWSDGKEIFILGRSLSEESIVYHGRKE